MLKESLNFDLLKMCSTCGACYHICPSCLNFDGYDPRAVIRDVLRGEQDRWIQSESIWQCLECHLCVEMCYQHYGFENAMTALRKLASKKGHFPPQVKRGWDMFVKTSKLGEPVMPARKKLGLPEPAKSGAEEFAKLVAAYRASKKSAVCGGKTSEKAGEGEREDK